MVVRTLSEGELTIYGEGTRVGSSFIVMPGIDSICNMEVQVTSCI